MADDDARARRTTKATGAPARKAAGTAKVSAGKAVAKQAVAKKAVTAKAVAKKAVTANAAPPKKAAPARKAAPTKKVAAPRSAATTRPAVKKAAPASSGRDRSTTLTPRKRQPPKLRLAAEQTFADDPWVPPAAQPVREDPAARLRSVLRAAALSIEAKSQGASPVTVPSPAPPPPRPPYDLDEPVTRVLVAPVDVEADIDEDELDEAEPDDEWSDDDDADWPEDEGAEEPDADPDGEDAEDEWSAPTVLDDAPPVWPQPAPPTPAPPFMPELDVDSIPPAFEPPAPKGKASKRGPSTTKAPRSGRGPAASLLAILLALVVPVVGGIAGFVLASRARRRGAALASLARVISALALVGWLVGAGVFAFATLRDQGVDYSKLKVGDCYGSSSSNEVRGVNVKPCAEPHNSEIFFLVTHPAGAGDPYPGKDALVQFAADACLGKPLTDYLGVPLEQSKLKDFEIVPQASAWKDGRRVLVCGLDTGGAGNITGSVKGTRR